MKKVDKLKQLEILIMLCVIEKYLMAPRLTVDSGR